MEASHENLIFCNIWFFFILYVVYIPPSLHPSPDQHHSLQDLPSSEIWKGRKENLSLFMDRSLLMKLKELFKTESWHATNFHIMFSGHSTQIKTRTTQQQFYFPQQSKHQACSLTQSRQENILESSETQTSNPKRFRQNRCYSYLHISFVFIFILWILF